MSFGSKTTGFYSFDDAAKQASSAGKWRDAVFKLSNSADNWDELWDAAGEKSLIELLIGNLVRGEGIDLEMHTNDDELDIALPGNALKKASPMYLLVQVTSIITTPGALAGDSEIKVGTTSDGDEILAATVLGAGMDAVGKQIRIPIASTTLDLAGDAHVYVRCDKADTTVTELIVKVRLVLEQF